MTILGGFWWRRERGLSGPHNSDMHRRICQDDYEARRNTPLPRAALRTPSVPTRLTETPQPDE